MLTAPLVSQPLNATLPAPAPVQERVKPPQLQLEVGDDGAYRLDGRPVSLQQLGQRLQEAVSADANAVLSVHATSNADYQRMVSALAEARSSGVIHIGMRP